MAGLSGRVSPRPVTPDIPRRESTGNPGCPMVSRMLRSLLLAAALAGVLAVSAGAGTIVVKLRLTPGKLAVSAPTTSIKAGTTASLKVRVLDGRRDGAGWTLRFARGTGVKVTGITARCAAHSTCTLPTLAAKPAGKTVLRAAKATGMGLIDLVVTVRASSTTTVRFSVS